MISPYDVNVLFGGQLPFYLTVIIIAVGIFLFVKEYFTIDVTAILIMAMFIVSGILAPEEGFAGFTNPATITVACMFVLSFGLFRSGVLDPVIMVLVRLGRWHFLSALVALMIFAAALSAFINDTAVVALLMPAAIRLAERTGVPPGKLLMPLSFAALLGGVCTLIGTSTNILVSGIAEQMGYAPLGMFEFAPAAIWLTLAGIAYLLTMGLFLLPARPPKDNVTSPTAEFFTIVRLGAGCRAINRKLGRSFLVSDLSAEILSIRRRSGVVEMDVDESLVLREGDELTLAVRRDQLRELRTMPGVRMLTEHGGPVPKGGLRLFEVVIPNGSRLTGSGLTSWTLLKELEHGVVGLRRNARNRNADPNDLLLAEGDILLVANTRRSLFHLIREDVLTIIEEFEMKKVERYKAFMAVLVMAGVIGFTYTGSAPIVLTAMIGVLALLVTRVITPEEAYSSVEWKVIFLLAGVLSMGAALQKTGGDQMIASGLAQALGDGSPRLALGVLFLITFVSTNLMSNNATAALMTPIALQLATAMSVSERPFMIGVMFASSLAFMTPMGYQTNSMVYLPGNYRFNDYLRVGTPLNLIVWIVAMIVIPLYFPF